VNPVLRIVALRCIIRVENETSSKIIISRMTRILSEESRGRVLGSAKRVAGFFCLTKDARALLIASAILMGAWSFVVPIFDAPDEPSHWQYARYLRHNKKLPEYTAMFQEANSPPLYYLLVAPFAKHSEVPPHLVWIDNDGFLSVPSPPRFMQISYSDFGRYWPIRITRLATIFISLFTVLFCYKGGLEAAGNERTGLLAGALAAFLPQFTFRGMNVSNDAMVAALGSLTVYILIRMVKRGTSGRIAIAAGIAMAGAFLSKATALFFPGAFALTVLTERIPINRRLKLLCLGAGTSLVLAAPWLLDNQLKYGDPLAKGAMSSVVPFLIQHKSITSPYFLHLFPRSTAMSLAGVFGWMNVPMPAWIYRVFTGLVLVAAAGYAVGLIRRQISWRLTVTLASIVALNIFVVVDINLMFDQPQGRYMFPALAAIAVLGALGLEGVLSRPSFIRRLPIVALLLLNLYVLFAVVLPAYWPEPQMATTPAVAALTPGSFSGLSRAKDGDDLTVTGDNPQIVMNTDLPAESYNFLTFNIRGAPDHVGPTGFAYLKMCGCDPAPDWRIPFKWKCDGTERKIIIPLYSYPEWQGRLAELRLILADPPDSSLMGTRVQISGAELVSFISDTTGP